MSCLVLETCTWKCLSKAAILMTSCLEGQDYVTCYNRFKAGPLDLTLTQFETSQFFT